MDKRFLAWGMLLTCEVASAAVYARWAAPRLAAQHLELETAGPLLAGLLFLVAVIAVCIRGAVKKKIATHTLVVLVSLLILSIFLYGIGLHTECPVCSSPFF